MPKFQTIYHLAGVGEIAGAPTEAETQREALSKALQHLNEAPHPDSPPDSPMVTIDTERGGYTAVLKSAIVAVTVQHASGGAARYGPGT
jgi:hypothetical protein